MIRKNISRSNVIFKINFVYQLDPISMNTSCSANIYSEGNINSKIFRNNINDREAKIMNGQTEKESYGSDAKKITKPL